MKTAGGIHAYHVLAAFLVIVLLECVSVKDESLLLSNQLSGDDDDDDDDDDEDDDDDNDAEDNEMDDMRSLPRKRSSKKSSKKSSRKSSRKSSKSSTKSIKNRIIISIAEIALRKLIKRAIKGSFGQVLNSVGSEFKAIYPGTAWCGDGDIAKHPDDLGLFQKTDACCRDHDNCPESMAAGERKYGLRNDGIFTRSHCDCDLKFYNCLKDANTPISKKIGYTYFNVLRPQCYKNDYPAKCEKYNKSKIPSEKRCVRYSYDTRKRKKWQWFDNPEF